MNVGPWMAAMEMSETKCRSQSYQVWIVYRVWEDGDMMCRAMGKGAI